MYKDKKIGIIGGPAFHRDGFSDSIFGWVVFDDLTDMGRHAQLHIFRRVMAGPPINFNLLDSNKNSELFWQPSTWILLGTFMEIGVDKIAQEFEYV